MKKLAFLFFIFSFTYYSKAQDCQLIVKIVGVEKIEGNLIVAIFNNEDDYLENPVTSMTLSIKDKENSACFNELPDGTYSVSVIHDLDKNGELNTRLYGPPSEPYGFHNNVKGFMGPPSFEDTSFKLKRGDKKETEIRLFE